MQYVPGMPWQGTQWTNQQLAQWYWWQNHMMLNKKEKGKNVQANINQKIKIIFLTIDPTNP